MVSVLIPFHISVAAGQPLFVQLSGWLVSLAIIVIGLFVLGASDLVEFRFSRAWAISGVSFAESIRRRVLWVTPLAILGVIIVSQLQRPIDEQDAIRQTTKFCLFTSGLLVTLTAVLLACTNLPKEIENRVIYTIVTKPTTRLEIILGKVMGFARVAAAVLLIMGVFTYAYLQVRAWAMRSEIEQRLKTEPRQSAAYPTLEHYAQAGLLNTESLERPPDVEVYLHPSSADDTERWMGGGFGEYFLTPFNLSPDDINALDDAQKQGAPVYVVVTTDLASHPPTADEAKDIHDMALPLFRAPNAAGKAAGAEAGTQSATQPATAPADLHPVPQLMVQVLDSNRNPLHRPSDINEGHNITIPPPDPGKPAAAHVQLPSDLVERLLKTPRFYVEVGAVTPSFEYGAKRGAVALFIPGSGAKLISAAPDPFHFEHSDRPRFYTQSGRYGMQLTSRADGSGPVAVYEFRHADVGAGRNGSISLETNIAIERGGEFDVNSENLSRVSLQVRNRKTGVVSPLLHFSPETNRTSYVDAPLSAVEGGDFDVMIQGLTRGQLLGIPRGSLALVTASTSFASNLFKSLFILWLLAVLVIMIAVFCSTFLSWPIAIVLTLVVLLGRWGVDQLGDSLAPGFSRGVMTDMGFSDPTQIHVVGSFVEGLGKLLTMVATVLPDVSRFPVTEDIQRGISIPAASVMSALAVVLGYGLPITVLGYIVLKNKEVAP